MFTFKVMISTLIIVTMIIIGLTIPKQTSKSGRQVGMAMILLYAASVIAIWG